MRQVANVSAKAANFKGKGFLLIHGTADGQFFFVLCILCVMQSVYFRQNDQYREQKKNIRQTDIRKYKQRKQHDFVILLGTTTA